MKRFAFSLEKLLALRDFREREAEIELGRANSVCERIRQDLETVARNRFSTARSRRSGARIDELRAIENYIILLDKQKERLLEELSAAELVLEQKRELYLSAHRDREVLTRLREKKAESFRKEWLNEEAAILDDINNSRDLREKGPLST